VDSALAWIGQVAEWFGQFIPRRQILDTTEGAIKYVGGSTPKVCRAGVHWWWPYTTTWVMYPTARQTDRLENQTLETADGKTFVVSGTITYEVEDIAALVTTTFSPMVAIKDLASTALHDVCSDYEWGGLQEGQRKGTLKTKLKNEAQKTLKDYGVRVIKFQLNTLARTRVLKVSLSTSSEEN
jgi:regulator of protease activity HflC (stomatin/prohibitin superfamily)